MAERINGTRKKTVSYITKSDADDDVSDPVYVHLYISLMSAMSDISQC